MSEIVDDLALGTDLKVKVTQAWRDFAQALTGVLAGLATGAQLDITLDPTASGVGDVVYGVTLHRGDHDTLGALAVGNASLPEGYRLERAAVGELVALGWSPPGVVDGSGDDFGLTATLDQATTVAITVARTLRDVYGAPHPAFLMYAGQDVEGEPVTVGPLGAARPVLPADPGTDGLDGLDAADAEAADPADAGTRAPRPAPTGAALVPTGTGGSRRSARDALPLADQVATIVAALLKTTPEALNVDADGDIGIRSGSAMVFVRVRDNPPMVDVFSPILTGVKPTEALYVKLSELTNRMPIGRLYCTGDTVWASIPVFGRDFQPTHLSLAVQVMTGLADELDDRLHGEFGGKRFFVEGDSPALHGPPSERTGMYL